MGPFCLEFFADVKSLDTLYSIKTPPRELYKWEEIVRKGAMMDIDFDALEKLISRMPTYLLQHFHDEITAQMTMGEFRGRAFQDFLLSYTRTYANWIFNSITAYAGIDPDKDVEKMKRIRSMIDKAWETPTGRKTRAKLYRIKRLLDEVVDAKATLIYYSSKSKKPEADDATMKNNAYAEASLFALGLFQMMTIPETDRLKDIRDDLYSQIKRSGIPWDTMLTIRDYTSPMVSMYKQGTYKVFGWQVGDKIYSGFRESDIILDHERQHYIYNNLTGGYVKSMTPGLGAFMDVVRPEAINLNLPRFGFIGRVTDRNGQIITDFTDIKEDKGRITVIRDGETIADLPLVPHGKGGGRTVSKDVLLRDIERSLRNSPESVEHMNNRLNGLIETLRGNELSEIIPLAQAPENPDIKGLIANNKLYLNEYLYNNPLALIHELGEGYIVLPEEKEYINLTRHTFMRGVGKDVRNALNRLLDRDKREAPENRKIIANIPPDELVDLIDSELEKMASSGEISKDRVNMKQTGQEARYITASEMALIRLNYDNNITDGQVIWGMQDFLDPAGNLAFTAEIRILTDDLRRGGLNIFLIPSGKLESQTYQRQAGQEAARKFKKMGNNTMLLHFDETDTLEAQLTLALEIAREEKNMKLTPKIYINTFTDPQSVRKDIESVIKGYPEKDKELARRMIVIGKDSLPEGENDISNIAVDDVRIITVGSAILNDNRLSVDFERTPEELRDNRLRMLTAFVNSGILKDSVLDDTSAPGLENVMRNIYAGITLMRITPIRWENMREYYDSMKQVLRSL